MFKFSYNCLGLIVDSMIHRKLHHVQQVVNYEMSCLNLLQ